MHHIIIVSAHPTIGRWRTLPEKIAEIENELNTMRLSDFSINLIERPDLVPHVVNGRITHDWMDWLRNDTPHSSFDFVMFHMSDEQRKEWGIKPTLRGAHQRDYDLVAETYHWADEKTLRQGRNQFVQTALHELRHALCRGMRIPDNTHAYHADGQIKGSFRHLDMADYQPALVNQARQLTFIERAIAYLARLVALEPPLYRTAKNYLGRDASPQDIAPDLLGCAESVSCIIRDVLPDFPIITGTWTLWRRLESDLRFEKVISPKRGDIIISPTGTVGNAPYPGHTGIYHDHGDIMSNDSYTGYWERNYTTETWQSRWGEAGFPIYYYRLIS